jgi:predicted amino acid racemase
MNAQIEEKKSRDTLRRGQLEEQKKRMQVAGIKGQQLAAMGANNVDVSFGSPMETVIDTATLGEIDALTVRTNAHREAYDYRVQAANDRAQASMYKMSGKQALTGGYLAAAGTVVAGASDAWGKFSSMAGGGGGFGGGGSSGGSLSTREVMGGWS